MILIFFFTTYFLIVESLLPGTKPTGSCLNTFRMYATHSTLKLGIFSVLIKFRQKATPKISCKIQAHLKKKNTFLQIPAVA